MITLHAAAAPAPSFVPRGPGLDAVVPDRARSAVRPCLATSRDAAWLRLWTTVLGLAFLSGQPVPSPPPAVRAAALYQPRRTDRLVASLAVRLTTERGAALRACYPPAALARALTSTGRRLLADQPVPPRAGQVWVIPQLRWAYEAARVGWDREGARPGDLAPPLDFALAGLPDWPGILVGQRLILLLRHPVSLTGPANSALAATALFGADGKTAFCRALAADLELAFPTAARSSRTDNRCSPGSRPDPQILAEAMRLMDCPRDWLIAFLR